MLRVLFGSIGVCHKSNQHLLLFLCAHASPLSSADVMELQQLEVKYIPKPYAVSLHLASHFPFSSLMLAPCVLGNSLR